MTAKKKKMVKGLVVVALIAIIGIGATLAYLTASTGAKSNKFSSNSKIEGKTIETEWDKTHKDGWTDYKPGDTTAKDPSVILTKGSESGYVALQMDFVDNAGQKRTYDDFTKYASYDKINDGWTLIAKNQYGSELYIYETPVEPSATNDASPANTLFNNITTNAGITSVGSSSQTTFYKRVQKVDANGKVTYDQTTVTATDAKDSGTVYYDANGNVVGAGTTLPSFQIDINGYAVQSANVDLATAKTQLIALANKGLTTTDAGYFTAV